jgi:hypothetical protein
LTGLLSSLVFGLLLLLFDAITCQSQQLAIRTPLVTAGCWLRLK